MILIEDQTNVLLLAKMFIYNLSRFREQETQHIPFSLLYFQL